MQCGARTSADNAASVAKEADVPKKLKKLKKLKKQDQISKPSEMIDGESQTRQPAANGSTVKKLTPPRETKRQSNLDEHLSRSRPAGLTTTADPESKYRQNGSSNRDENSQVRAAIPRQEMQVSDSDKSTDHSSDTLSDIDVSDLSAMLRRPVGIEPDQNQESIDDTATVPTEADVPQQRKKLKKQDQIGKPSEMMDGESQTRKAAANGSTVEKLTPPREIKHHSNSEVHIGRSGSVELPKTADPEPKNRQNGSSNRHENVQVRAAIPRQEMQDSDSDKSTDHSSDTLSDFDISDLSAMLRRPVGIEPDQNHESIEPTSFSENRSEAAPSPKDLPLGGEDNDSPDAHEANVSNGSRRRVRDDVIVDDSSNSSILACPSDLSDLLRAPHAETLEEIEDLTDYFNRSQPLPSLQSRDEDSEPPANSEREVAESAQPQPQPQPSAPVQYPPANGTPAAPRIPTPPVIIQQVPVMVPAPQAAPIQQPQDVVDADTVPNTSSQGSDTPVKLPEINEASETIPAESGAVENPEESDIIEKNSESSVHDLNLEADQSQTTLSQMNRRRAALRTLFQTELDQARAFLQKQQTPTTDKTPRAIRKITSAIESLDGKDVEGLVKQLENAGATKRAEAVDILRDHCGHGHKDVRKTCIEQLGRIPAPAAALALVPMLKDRVPELVIEACKCILDFRIPEVQRSIVALGAFNVAVRPVVRDILLEFDTDDRTGVIENLKKILAERHPNVPEFPAFSLQLLAAVLEEEGLKLYQKYATHDVEELRATAIEALATTDHKQNVRFFNKAMQDPKPGVQAAAAKALSRLHSPKSVALLIAGLKSPANRVRRNSASTLAGLEDPDQKIARAASKAVQNETDPATLDSLLDIISRGGTEEAIGTLQKFAHGDDAEARYRAIQSLRKLKHERSIEVLLPLLEHSDAKTRRASVEAIGKLSARKASGQITRMLKEDRDEAVRASCARALGDFANVKAIPALEEALQDSKNVQIQAVIALGMIRSSDAIPALLALLRHATPEIRLHACSALGQIGGIKNTEKIEALLDDKEAMVRRAAENCMEKLGVTPRGSKAVRNLKRRLAGLGSSLVPSFLLSIAPGKTGGLIALGAIAILAGAVFLGSQAINMLSSPGSQFPVTRISSISVSTNGQTAYASRGNGVIDIWDLEEGALLDRFKPTGKYAVLSNSAGDKAVLYSSSKAVLYEKEKGFSEAIESASLPIKGIAGQYQPADQSKLWVSSQNGNRTTLSLLDRETFAVSTTVEVPESIPELFAINNDQTMVVVPMIKGLKLFVGKDLKPAPRLLEVKALLGKGVQPGSVKAAAFNASGKVLALACERALVSLELPEGKIIGVQFQDEISSGDRLISVRFDGDTNDVTAISARGALYRSKNDFTVSETVPAADRQSLEHFSVTPDNSVFVYSPPTSKDLFVADLKAGKIKHELKGKQ